MKLSNDELPYELTDEYLDGIADPDEDDGEEDCGRWRNGTLVSSCLSAGTEWCDWNCPIGPHRRAALKDTTQSDDLGLVAKLRGELPNRVVGVTPISGIREIDFDWQKIKAERAEAAAAIERLVAEVAAADLRTGAASKLALELTAERDEARKLANNLASGVNGVVNFQSALTRAQVRESMSDLLISSGLQPWSTEDQSPFAARAGRLSEALKAIKGGVRADGRVWIDNGTGGLEPGPSIGEFVDQALGDT